MLITASSLAWAAAQESTAKGRAVFDQSGCQGCHSYVSRRGAPPVRDMLRDYNGELDKVARAIRTSPAHAADASAAKLPESALRQIASWLANDYWPDDDVPAASAATPEPAVPSVTQSVAAATVSETLREPVLAAAPVLPAVPVPVVVPAPVVSAVPAVSARPLSEIRGPALAGLRLQKNPAGGDRLVVEIVGGEPDEIDLQQRDGQLVVRLRGVALADSGLRAATSLEAGQVVERVRMGGEAGHIDMTVAPRHADWTYTALQGRNRLTIDLVATAPRSVPVVAGAAPQGKPVAPAVAAAGAGKAAVAAAAKSAPATGVAIAGAAVVKSVTPGNGVEKAAAEDVQRKEAEARARREAEMAAKAKKEAELQAKAKKEADARKEAESRKDAELAQAKKKEPEVDAGWQAAEARSGEKSKRKAPNRPYKEAKLEPCPPPKPADQVIGVVDVELAKEIIDRIGCPQCHAYVQKKTGTPFREVLKKYAGDPACVVHRLKTNETHRDEGVTKDIRPNEFKILADYVATRMKKD